jgi:hypothetical protein
LKVAFWVLAALLLAAASTVSADPAPPQWLLNLDGAFGTQELPGALAGDPLVGGAASVEWLPQECSCGNQYWGLDLGYDHLSVGKSPHNDADNDVDFSMSVFPATFGITTLTLQGGLAYNATANAIDAHYSAFAGPGLRMEIAQGLAVDASLLYQVRTPSTDLSQSLQVRLGFSVPLGGAFTVCRVPKAPQASAPMQEAAWAPGAASPAPAPSSAPVSGAGGAAAWGTYVVKAGDDLWQIAGKPAVFGDSRYWPLLLAANRDTVGDPNALTPGATLYFKLKRFYSPEELAAAREKESRMYRPKEAAHE